MSAETEEHEIEPEKLYRTGVAARRWGLASSTVRGLLDAGEVAGVRIGRDWRLRGAEILRVEREGTGDS